MADPITIIPGTDGDDFALGSAAAELFRASAGNDVLDGLAGDDWYTARPGLRVSLLYGGGDPALFPGLVWKFDRDGFYLGLDYLARIRHFAGAEFDDVIFLDWDDSTLDGGPGSDMLDGGDGRDTLAFTHPLSTFTSPRGAWVDLSANSALDPWGGTDFIINIENVSGTPLADELIGDFQANTLTGDAGDDTLEGRMGDDRLDGGPGADVMRGGLGDDLLLVDDPGDLALESADEGFDVVELRAATWVLPAGSAVELVRVMQPGAVVDGNELANILEAAAGAAELNGMGGNDTLLGSAGDDILRGGLGANRLEGGSGDDRYQVASLSDRVIERPGEGTDSVWVRVDGWRAPAHVENVYLEGEARSITGADTGQNITANPGLAGTLAGTLAGGAGDDALWGSALAETLLGGAGNDVLRSGGGADTMRGGPGDDAYDVRDARTVVEERPGEGFDQAWVYANDWRAAAHLEAVYLAGDATRLFGSAAGDVMVGNQALGGWLQGLGGDDTLWGTPMSDTLEGGEGNDILRGQGGGLSGDIMLGGPGDDHAVIFSTADLYVEGANGGHDTAYVAVNGWRVPVHVEVAYLVGDATQLVRFAGAGHLVAHPFLASTVTGFSGDDILWGGTGADTLTGNAGNDQFRPNLGADLLRPGAGHAWFGHDFVYDFSGAWGDGDRIDLRGTVAGFGELAVTASEAGSRISTWRGLIEMVGIAPGQLTAADFLF